MLPSMFVLLALSLIYVKFGNLPWIAAMFNGLKPAVIALVVIALHRVAKKSSARTCTKWRRSSRVCLHVLLSMFRCCW